MFQEGRINMDQATNFWREAEVSLLKQKWGKFLKGKILDLGCGGGEIARQVFGKKIDWGLDNDKKMIEKAEKSGVYRRVILGDAGKIDLKDGVVNLVFSNSVLEHIKDIDKVLREVKRVLKPGGLLIATMPSDKLGEYLGWGKWYAWWFNRKYHHYHLYSLEKREELLSQAGLKLVDSYCYLDKPTIKQWHELLWLNKLGLKKSVALAKARFLDSGAAVAILARKL